MPCTQVLARSRAEFVSYRGLECVTPLTLLERVYGNDSTPSHAACEPNPSINVLFRLLLLSDAGSQTASDAGRVMATAMYKLVQCMHDSHCLNGGRCWHGTCQCAFGWCGAFCNSPADNLCGLPTEVWPCFQFVHHAALIVCCVLTSCPQALRKFHVISFGSYTGIGGSDVQGYLAVAGNTTISHYSVSDQMLPPSTAERFTDDVGRSRTTRDDVVVCGNLTFMSGAVMGGGNLAYTDTAANIRMPAASVYAPGLFVQVPSCPVDFDDALARLQSLSAGLASLVRTGTSVVRYTYVNHKTAHAPDVLHCSV
jgi:hypothetical protein